MQKCKVNDQSVPKIEWKQTDRRTDGCDRITSHANASVMTYDVCGLLPKRAVSLFETVKICIQYLLIDAKSSGTVIWLLALG